jgi:putative restriction endonuclease
MSQGLDTDSLELDRSLRLAAFAFLEKQTVLRGSALPRALLAEGFVLNGVRVPLMGPQGIFKPRALPDMPLSITTVPVVEGRPRPYEDEIDPGGLLVYRYRGTDPDHVDNARLRLAMLRRAPLIYFYGLVPGEYLPVWPVFVVDDQPAALTFKVAVEAPDVVWSTMSDGASLAGEDRRRYITATTLRRLHQEAFRVQVLRAYMERCAVCRLRHSELLDAAHILEDRHPRGIPVVANGLALCKLHHAAFDRHILGVRPDLVIEIRQDVLDEHDGPMLMHGLQGFQGTLISVPRADPLRPNRELLAERYALFRKAG